MKFVINRETFLKPLQFVSGVVERRQTLPILSNLLLSVADDTLSLTGTDQEVELSGVATIESGEPGEVTVPARKLMEICRSLPEGATITGDLGDSRLSLQSGRFKSQLATLPATDFPNVKMEEGYTELEISASDLKRLIDRTGFAMAQQDVRYFFNGMLLEIKTGSLRCVATNGQRLATCHIESNVKETDARQVIIPRKGVLELSRLLAEGRGGEIHLQLSDNHLRALCGESVLTTKLIDGTYPDYQRAIPSGGDKVFEGDRQEIREALSRTSILSNEMYRNVRLRLTANRLELHANNPQQEEAEETVSVDYSGEDLDIGFNVGYLLDVLGVMSCDKIRFTLSDANGAALIEEVEPSDSLFVVSPMML